MVKCSGYFKSALQSSSLTAAKRSTSYEQIEKILTQIKDEGKTSLRDSTGSSPPRPKLTSRGSLKNLVAKHEKKFLKLSFPDPDGIFPFVLKYLYEGTINLTIDNVLPCLHMANYLLIYDLKRRVNEYLNQYLNRNNVVILLKKALELKLGKNYLKFSKKNKNSYFLNIYR